MTPSVFKIRIPDGIQINEGETVGFKSLMGTLTATYCCKSRIDGQAIFKTGGFSGEANYLNDIFDGKTTLLNELEKIESYPALISTLEDPGLTLNNL